MDESNAIRAITIGVSTLIAIATISAVLMYYNTAKATVQEIGTGVDLYGNYASYVKDILVKPSDSTVSGTDVINLLNYFYKNTDVNISVSKIHCIYQDASGDKKISSTEGMNLNNPQESAVKNTPNAYEKYINNINPTQDVTIKVKDLGDGKLNITLTGNAYS